MASNRVKQEHGIDFKMIALEHFGGHKCSRSAAAEPHEHQARAGVS
jgi:hypothetical protein